MASIVATLVNIHNTVNKEEGKEVQLTSAADFMPIWDKKEREKQQVQSKKQSVEEIKAGLLSVFKGSNYTIKDGKRIRIPKPKPKRP